MRSFLEVPPEFAGEIPLIILNFSSLSRDLKTLSRLFGAGGNENAAHLNKNPLKEKYLGYRFIWTFVTRIMLLFTDLYGDYTFTPRGKILITDLPLMETKEISVGASHLQ